MRLYAAGMESIPVERRHVARSEPPRQYDLPKIAQVQDVFTATELQWTVENLPVCSQVNVYDSLRHQQNEDARTTNAVLVVGDSFRTAMLPALMEAFHDVYDIHRGACGNLKSILDETKPCFLVMEFVERYADAMSSYARRFADSLE